MPRRYLLSETAAERVRGLVARRGGVEFDERRIASVPSGDRLMPFDCRVRIVYDAEPGEGERTGTPHVFCYVPSFVPIVLACGGSLTPSLTLASGQTVDDDWLDVGAGGEGACVVLGAIVPSADWARYGFAAALYGNLSYCIVSGASRAFTPPAGYVDMYAIVPPIVLGRVEGGVFRQHFHGIYSADWSIADEIVTGTAFDRAGPSTKSVATTDYNGDPGVISLHGFRTPTTIANPYATGGTPPQQPNDYLVLVRVLDASGTPAELKYLPLADLAASAGGGAPALPQIIWDVVTIIQQMLAIPCPADGNGDAAIWDPCMQSWRSLRDMADIFAYALAGRFWVIGSDETECNGSAIGDTTSAKVIDLDAKALEGEWTAADDFSVGSSSASADILVYGGVFATGDVFATNSTLSGNLSATGAVYAGGDVVATGNLEGAGLKINGDLYLPETVTINGVQKTILVKQ